MQLIFFYTGLAEEAMKADKKRLVLNKINLFFNQLLDLLSPNLNISFPCSFVEIKKYTVHTLFLFS